MQLSSRMRISQRDTFAVLLLGVLVAIIYFPATQAGFVWDDAIMRELVAVSTWGGIWEIWFDPVSAYLLTSAHFPGKSFWE